MPELQRMYLAVSRIGQASYARLRKKLLFLQKFCKSMPGRPEWPLLRCSAVSMGVLMVASYVGFEERLG